MWAAIISAIISILTEAANTTLTWIDGENAIEAEENAAIEAINADKDTAITTIKRKISNQNAIVTLGAITLIIVVIILTSED
jgi:hypothetical protein